MDYETVIGLEVHVQLKTKSKMFCRCDNRDDQAPNTAICHICTGQPGALPLPNGQAIDWAIMTALALGCRIHQQSKFDRKSYFYPDLPKGYQISQYDQPFGVDGKVTISIGGEAKAFRIHRLHLEEDAGKLVHTPNQDASLVDLNRAGTPLMEIVSEPDFRSPAEARAYVQELQLIARYLGVSDADMEKGHLRCDANVSLRPVGDTKLYPKTEIKNMNSFKAIEQALTYEIRRQQDLWADGMPPTESATRGWDEASGTTKEQRTKEGEADYRYFPEPDIPSIVVSDDHLDRLRESIPELPNAMRQRIAEEYSVKPEVSVELVRNPGALYFFEKVVSEANEYYEDFSGQKSTKPWALVKNDVASASANFILNKMPPEHLQTGGAAVPANDVGRLMVMVHLGHVSGTAAVQQVYPVMAKTKRGPHEVVKELGLEQVSDTAELQKIVTDVIAANEKVVVEVRAGKTAGIQFLVGQVMKQTKGRANPQVVQEILKKSLG